MIKTGGQAPNLGKVRVSRLYMFAEVNLSDFYSPEERPPAMGSCINEAPRKHCSKQVPEGISLLQHPAYDPSCSLRTVFQRRRRSVAIQPSHGNAEQRTTSQELIICFAEPRAEFKDNEEDVVDDERPLPAIPISGDTWGLH